jgi:hypothetical protein
MCFAPLDAIEDPGLAAFVALWESRRGKGAMPERADIKPRDLKDYLSDIHLYEVIEGGRDFRMRLVGTRFSQAAGYDPTGDLLSRVASESAREPMFACARRAVETAAPIYAYAGYRLWGCNIEAVMAPLATDGVLSHVLGYVTARPR